MEIDTKTKLTKEKWCNAEYPGNMLYSERSKATLG